jgi:hypothetical protein
MARSLRTQYSKCPPLKATNGLACSDAEKAELAANYLAETFQPNPQTPETANLHQLTAESPHPPPAAEEPPSITTKDVVTGIKSLPSRKSPGPDGIRNEQLKQLPVGAGTFLALIFSACIRLGYFPAVWKKAKIICLPKPGKAPSKVENYRPISLLDTMGKLMERLILPFILRFLAEKKILPPMQFGFRKEHSTHHALLQATGFITASLNFKKYCAAAFLDVSKAFDRVWHEGLTWKLRQLGFPDWQANIVHSFLESRTFHVSWRGERSTEHQIRAGVPQGSVIAPHLYSIYTADFPRALDWNSAVSLYADDTALLSRSWSAKVAAKRLQTALSSAAEWCAKWRTALNPAKTQAVLFKGKLKPATAPELRLLGNIIPWSRTALYLGIQLDEKMKYRRHVQYVLKNLKTSLSLLNPLLRSPDIRVGDRLRLYRAIIIPRILYASPVWSGEITKGDVHKLEIAARKILRLITKTPRWASNDVLYIVAKEKTLRDRMEEAARDFFKKAKESSVETINAFANDVPMWWDSHRRPIASTGLAEHQPP